MICRRFAGIVPARAALVPLAFPSSSFVAVRFVRTRTSAATITAAALSSVAAASQRQQQPAPSKFDAEDEMLTMGLSPLLDSDTPPPSSPGESEPVSAAPKSKPRSFDESVAAAASASSLALDLERAKQQLRQQMRKEREEEKEDPRRPTAERPIIISSGSARGGGGRAAPSQTHHVRSRNDADADEAPEDPVLGQLGRNAARRTAAMQRLLPEMERRQRTRGLLMRSWVKKDVAQVIRRTALASAASGSNIPFAVAAAGSASSSSSHQQQRSDRDLALGKVRELVVSETDPLESRAREEVCTQFYDAVEQRLREIKSAPQRSGAASDAEEAAGGDDDDDEIHAREQREDALLDVIEGMGDADLAAVLKAGAVDPVALWEAGDADTSPRTSVAAEEEDGVDVLSYRAADRALTLARELADLTQPQNPTDDEAQLVADADAGRLSEFSHRVAAAPASSAGGREGAASSDDDGGTDADNESGSDGQRLQKRGSAGTCAAAATERSIAQLEAFERRQAFAYTEQPNVVLQHLSRLGDGKIRASLEALDRAKRAMLRDTQFQAALAHVRMLEAQQIAGADVTATRRKPAAETSVPFFDKAHSRPPRSAMPLPEPQMTAHGRIHSQSAIDRRKQQKRERKQFSGR